MGFRLRRGNEGRLDFAVSPETHAVRPTPRQARKRFFLLCLGGLFVAAGTYAAAEAGFTDDHRTQSILASVAACVTGLGAILFAADPAMLRRACRSDIYLSFHSADSAWTQWLSWELTRSGYTVIPQPWSFSADEDLPARAAEALANKRYLIVVVSQALTRLGPLAESWVRSVSGTRGGRGRTLLVVVEPCAPSFAAWKRMSRADLVGQDANEARQSVLGCLHLAGARPAEDDLVVQARAVASRSGRSRQERDMPRYPGQGPLLTNMPLRPPNFTGRSRELAELYGSLMSGAESGTGTRSGTGSGTVEGHAIYGLGGVGKTQLAIEFSHRYANRYDLVWWVRAEQTATIFSDLLGLARALDIPEVKEQDEMLAQLWETLRQQHGRWLLVFDSAEGVGSLSRFWPPAGNGHVLVTSRNPAWGSLTREAVRLDVLTGTEALAFLRRRTRSRDVATLTEIAEALGRLPLALEQAGAYVERTNASPSSYRRLLRSQLHRLMASGEPPPHYDELVATTWSMSLAKAKEEEPAAEDLLALAAFFASAHIPLGLIERCAYLLPEPLRTALTNPFRYDTTIMSVTRYSLLATDHGGARIHPLVQAVVRNSLDDPGTWVSLAVTVLERGFPPDPEDDGSWSDCARLLPHVLVATEQASALGVATGETGRLLQRAADYLHARGEHADAQALMERALEIRERLFGSDDLEVAETLCSMGQLSLHRAELASARTLVQRALAIHQSVLGPNHSRTAEDLTRLGFILRELGELSAALTVTGQALEIRYRADPPNQVELAGSYNSLGLVLWRLGDYEKARQMHERALAKVEGVLRWDHATVAVYHMHLALVLKDQGELDEAQRHLDRGLAILDGTLGPDHPESIATKTHLADLLRLRAIAETGAGTGVEMGWEMGAGTGWPRPGREPVGSVEPMESPASLRWRAQGLFESVLATRLMRTDHPDLACALCRYGELLRDLGQPELARPLVRRAEHIYRTSNGERHPYVAEALHRLGPILDDLGETAAAESALAEAADIYRGSYGLDHPYLAALYRYLDSRAPQPPPNERQEPDSDEAAG